MSFLFNDFKEEASPRENKDWTKIRVAPERENNKR